MTKSVILTTILSVVVTANSFACEICGCNNQNFQIGILPYFTKGFIGLRYSAARFNSKLRSDASQYSHDYYQTTEIWGGYNFKKIQMMAFMPYMLSRKVSDDGIVIQNGLGDLMLMVQYKILRSTALKQNEKTTVRHDLFIGGGLKLPTGVARVNTANPDFNLGDFNSQAGTGSIDLLISAVHNVSWNNSGIVSNVSYRINTANRQDYRFGNRAYLNSSYYYSFTLSDIKIKPAVGINFQSNTKNSFGGTQVESSNGYNLNSTVGLNLLKKKIGFNVMALIPISQNMFDGQTNLKHRIFAGLTYSF